MATAARSPVAHGGAGNRLRMGIDEAELRRSPAALALLARARRELTDAEVATDPTQRFQHAHLAALRTAAAVLEMHPKPAPRGRLRTVWELTARAAPELSAWTAYFAAGASLRAAVESGRESAVSLVQADHLLSMAGMFLETVETPASVLARAS
jgi:hypothetical protein